MSHGLTDTQSRLEFQANPLYRHTLPAENLRDLVA